MPGDLRDHAFEHAEELIRQFGFVPITTFTKFEVIQGLRFEAWRNRNDHTKGFRAIQVEAALNLLAAEIGSAYQIVPVDWNLAFSTAELLSKNTAEKGWRAFDVIHVAAAIAHGANCFYSYDQDQNDLAALHNLHTPLRNR